MGSFRRRALAEAEDRAAQHGGLAAGFDAALSRVAADAARAEARFASACAAEAEAVAAEARARAAADAEGLARMGSAMERLVAIALELGGAAEE